MISGKTVPSGGFESKWLFSFRHVLLSDYSGYGCSTDLGETHYPISSMTMTTCQNVWFPLLWWVTSLTLHVWWNWCCLFPPPVRWLSIGAWCMVYNSICCHTPVLPDVKLGDTYGITHLLGQVDWYSNYNHDILISATSFSWFQWWWSRSVDFGFVTSCFHCALHHLSILTFGLFHMSWCTPPFSLWPISQVLSLSTMQCNSPGNGPDSTNSDEEVISHPEHTQKIRWHRMQQTSNKRDQTILLRQRQNQKRNGVGEKIRMTTTCGKNVQATKTKRPHSTNWWTLGTQIIQRGYTVSPSVRKTWGTPFLYLTSRERQILQDAIDDQASSEDDKNPIVSTTIMVRAHKKI